MKRLSVLSALSLLAVVRPLQAQEAATGLSRLGDAGIGPLDWAVVVLYLVGIVALGCWAGMRGRQKKGSDYFLASRSLSWPVIGTALFATNISTIHLVSFAQNGYTSGLTYGNYEWMAAYTLVILSLFFAPFYLRSKVATLPDFIEKRYSRGSRNYLAVLSMVSAIVVHIGFSLLTGAIVLEGTVLNAFVAEPERYRLLTIVGLCGVTALYTVVGGLLAVVLTESIQTVVLLAGSIAITVVGYRLVGGWHGLTESVHPVNLTMLRPSTDPTGVTWYAVFLGYPVLGVWYWCTDQTIVQRVLGAKDEHHARLGPLFAGFIKILPVFLFVLPGVVCLALVTQGKIPPLPALADGSPNTEQTYTHLVRVLLSPGFRGLVIAAMLAALMSTVSGALNSIATLFSYDIYRQWNPAADDRQLVRMGRLSTVVAMLVAIGCTMALTGQGTTIFQAMVDVFPAIAPPTAVVFLWGVFWRRTSARAALWTLISGSLAGLVVFALTRMGMLAINSLFMAFLLFVAESIFIFVVSLIWPHQHTAESESLVWRTPWEALRGGDTGRGLLDYRVAAALLVFVMSALYFAFSSRETYYPINGRLAVNGVPASGVAVVLDCDDDRFDAALVTDLEGRYGYGTKQKAGGAPAGTHYRVGFRADRNYLVVAHGHSDTTSRAPRELIAAVPVDVDVDYRPLNDGSVLVSFVRDGKAFVPQNSPSTFSLPPGTTVEYRRAWQPPLQYRLGGSVHLEAGRDMTSAAPRDAAGGPAQELVEAAGTVQRAGGTPASPTAGETPAPRAAGETPGSRAAGGTPASRVGDAAPARLLDFTVAAEVNRRDFDLTLPADAAVPAPETRLLPHGPIAR